MFTPAADRFKALEDLLCDLFGDLRPLGVFVRDLPDSRAMVEAVRIDLGTCRRAAEALVEVLASHNRADRHFFQALVDKFRNRAKDILAVQRKWHEIVLFLSASPDGMAALDGDDEARQIKAAIESVMGADRMAVVVHHDTDVDGWRRQIELVRPTIVHFSGHGNVWGRLVLESGDSSTDLPPGPMLAQLREVGVTGLILGACFSDRLAKAAVNAGVRWAVGMKDAVLDTVAVAYAQGFYEGLALGRTPDAAHEYALHLAAWHKLQRPTNPMFFAATAPGLPTPEPARGATTRSVAVGLGPLLTSMFDDAEDLRWFLRRDPELADLHKELAARVSVRETAESAADLLSRRGFVNPMFFQRLMEERSEFGVEIAGVAAGMGIVLATTPRWQPNAPSKEEIEERVSTCVADGRNVVVRLVSWPNDLEGPAPTFRLEAPAAYLGDRVVGEAGIAGPMQRIAEAVSRMSPTRTIEIIPQCTPSTAIRAGYAARRVTGLNVVVHLYGKPWLLRPAAPVASPVRILHPYAIEPRGVALLVSIAQEVEPLWKLWAAARGLNHPLEVVQVEPPEGRQRRTSLETAEEASAWAFAIGEAARAAKERAGGPIHVFAATPGPLSIAIGQELHALGPVTLWDRHPTEDRYRASYTFST